MEQGDDRSHVKHDGGVLGALRGFVRVVGDGTPRIPMNPMNRLPDIEG